MPTLLTLYASKTGFIIILAATSLPSGLFSYSVQQCPHISYISHMYVSPISSSMI
jgi:hypothetical protein